MEVSIPMSGRTRSDRASSTSSTPESHSLHTPSTSEDGFGGDDSSTEMNITPKPKVKTSHDTFMLHEQGNDRGKAIGSAIPPTFPVNVNVVSPTPPKMTRLPSLRELSDRLHSTPSPSPLHNGSNDNNKEQTRGADKSESKLQNISEANPNLHTPPKINTNVSSTKTITSPYTSSPSGRLKLPLSAMTRSHSSSSVVTSSSSTSTQSAAIAEDSEAIGGVQDKTNKPLQSLENESDPFSPVKGSAASGSMSRGTSADGFIKGYRDVPSLAAIRERVSFGKSSGKQVVETLKSQHGAKDGKENVSPQEIESRAKSPAISIDDTKVKKKAGEHPLEHEWTLYFDAKTLKPDPSITAANGSTSLLGDYEKSLVTLGKFDTVEGFARYFNNVRVPSTLSKNSNYHMFKDGIKPMWEDPANARGGKWVILFKSSPGLLDMCWANLTMSLVGEILDPDDEVSGVVASTKHKNDRIQIWTRGRDDVNRINDLGRRIVEALALEPQEMGLMSMEFQYNAAQSTPPANLFFSLSFAPARSSSFSTHINTHAHTSSTSHLPHAHAPPTPSKLNPGKMSTSPVPPSPAKLHHPSLPPIPKSPTLGVAQAMSRSASTTSNSSAKWYKQYD